MVSNFLIGYLLIMISTGTLAMIRMDHVVDVEETNIYARLFLSTLMGVVWPVFWGLYVYVKIKAVVV